MSPYDQPGEKPTGRRAPLRLKVGNAVYRARTARWPELVAVFAEHDLGLPPEHPGPGSVIAFRSDGRAVVLATALDRAADYVSVIDAALHDERGRAG